MSLIKQSDFKLPVSMEYIDLISQEIMNPFCRVVPGNFPAEGFAAELLVSKQEKHPEERPL